MVIETELSTKRFDSQIKETERKLKDVQETIDSNKTGTYKLTASEISELEAEAEKLNNTLIKLRNNDLKQSLSQINNINFNPATFSGEKFAVSTDKLGNSMSKLKGELPYVARNMNDLKIEEEKVEKTHNKTKNVISQGFEKGSQSLKKFAFRLVGITSIYRAVSKASSAYLSQDTELAEKLQSVWVGLGSILAPVIEAVSNALLKGLGYLNEFMKALTGTDFIANANAKALNKQAQAQKNLNNQMQQYSFDEMNIQNSSNSYESSASSTSGLIEIPELNSNVVKKLQDLAKWLKENKELIEGVGIALGVAFGVAKISGLLKNIGALMGSASLGTGLAGLAWILGIIATVWLGYVVIEGIGKAISETKKLNEELERNIEMHEDNKRKTEETTASLVDMAIAENWSGKQLNNVTNSLKVQSNTLIENSKALSDDVNWLTNLIGTSGKVQESQRLLVFELNAVNEGYWKLFEQGKLNDQQAQDYYNSLKQQIIIMGDLGYDVSELKLKYEKLTNSKYQIKVDSEFHDNITNHIENIIRKYSGSTIHINFDSERVHGGGGRAFAGGGIVTQPTRALIGEAGYPETVVPMTADYLSTLAGLIAQYGGSGGNTTIPIYLDGRLIQRQEINTSRKKDFITNS